MLVNQGSTVQEGLTSILTTHTHTHTKGAKMVTQKEDFCRCKKAKQLDIERHTITHRRAAIAYICTYVHYNSMCACVQGEDDVLM